MKIEAQEGYLMAQVYISRDMAATQTPSDSKGRGLNHHAVLSGPQHTTQI